MEVENTPIKNGEVDLDFNKLFENDSIQSNPSFMKKSQDSEVVNLINQNTKKTFTPFPIWYCKEVNKRPTCSVDESDLIDLLIASGHGEFNDSEFIKRGLDKILSVVDSKSVTTFVFELFESIDEKDYQNPDKLGVLKCVKLDEDGNEFEVYFTKKEVRKSLIKFKWFNDKNTIYLSKFSDNKKLLKNEKTKELYTPIFQDNGDEVFTYFQNGIVKTTQNGSKMIDYSDITDGYIWESRILDTVDEIKIDGNRKGDFEKFCELTMSVKDKNGDWKVDENEYKTFRTTYGYMLSNYTNNGDTPSPIFVDKDSDGVRAEGGNGKSFVMGSVEHWKKTLPINGKNIQEKDRFLFSGVQTDTEFVFLDDVNDDFNFKLIYNYVTGDVEVERKFQNRIVIPKDRKPKFGVATNYILTDTDWSSKRRQFIVEFGSFFHDLTKNGNSVQSYFGKRFFDDSQGWTNQDWIDFYNYGFKCIEEYLKLGVVVNPHSNYRKKQILIKLEGHGSNDGVVEWMVDYLITNELKFKTGVDYDRIIYPTFEKNFDEEVVAKWDESRLYKMIYNLCSEKKWLWNPHKNGKTMSQKRWLFGKKGDQTKWLRIHIPPNLKS